MKVYLNGEIVPAERAVVSVMDRGFLFGDGLFETIPCFHGKPFRWAQHFGRLKAGADYLGIELKEDSDSLLRAALALTVENALLDCLVRITVSRGPGLRGYSPKGANQPTLVVSLHPAPAVDPASAPQWSLITSSLRVPSRCPRAQPTTSNKLLQVMARQEAESQGADEALLLNTDGEITEAASSNIFWIEGGALRTPPAECGLLPGVTRAVMLELARKLAVSAEEKHAAPAALLDAEGAFLTVSSFGVLEISRLDGGSLQRSPLTQKLARAYHELVAEECR